VRGPRALLALGLTLAGAVASAQTPPDGEVAVEPPATGPMTAAPALAGPIVSVRVEPALPGENPWVRTGLAPGAVFSAQRAREALRIALASGTFAEARVSAREAPGGVELIVRGERRYRLQSYTTQGVGARAAEDVDDELGLRAGAAVTESRVQAALTRVESGYRDAGFPHPRVASRWRETDDPSVRVLVVSVEEGAPQRVGVVRWPGAPAEVVAALAAAFDLPAGAIAAPTRLRAGLIAARRALRTAGYLSGSIAAPVVRAEGTRVTVEVPVTPGPRYRMAWQGVRVFPVEALHDALDLAEEGIDGAGIDAILARVRAFYVRRGYAEVTVAAAVSDEGAGARVLRVTVREGVPARLGALRFERARALSEGAMRELFLGVVAESAPADPRPFAGPRDRERAYVESVVDGAARERVEQRLRDLGYLDATVSTPERAWHRSALRGPVGYRHPDVVDLTFTVTEGPRTFLEELRVEGNRERATADVAEALDLRVGVPLSYLAIEEARIRLTAWYREEGYAFVRAEPEIERSPDHTRARLRLVVHEGPRVRLGAVVIEGNRRTPEHVIRPRMTLAEGDWYRASEVRATQQRLSELGLFGGVNVGLEDPDLEAPVKVLRVQLVERQPQALELRGGFSLGEGLRFGFEYTHLNVLGRAVSFGLQARGGYLLQIPNVTPTFPPEINPSFSDLLNWRVAASLGFPFVPLLGPSWGAAVDLSTVRQLQPPFYALATHSVGASLLFSALRHFTMTFTGELQYVITQPFGAETIAGLVQDYPTRCLANGNTPEACTAFQQVLVQQLLRYSDGESVLGAFRVGAQYDRRNSALSPTRGFVASVTAETLQVVSASNPNLSPVTLHLTARVTGYVPIPLGRMVLLLSGRVGRNFGGTATQSTHPSRRFWLGGADAMRGWQQNQLIPQDLIDAALTDPSSSNPLVRGSSGGEFFMVAVADLRIPTPLDTPLGNVQLAAFVDVGNLWARPPSFDQLYRLRVSPGFGVRLDSPFGLISIDFGFNPWRVPEVGERTWNFQFSLGSVT
jgi:outer membrane protein insertion porin family